MLAEWDDEGRIVGGKLAEVEGRLDNIREVAFNELTCLVRFYYELHRDIRDDKEQRHLALQRIIGDSPGSITEEPLE